MPTAIIICNNTFANAGTGTNTIVKKGVVSVSGHRFNNQSYVGYSNTGTVNGITCPIPSYSGFPAEYSGCSINSIKISFQATALNTSSINDADATANMYLSFPNINLILPTLAIDGAKTQGGSVGGSRVYNFTFEGSYSNELLNTNGNAYNFIKISWDSNNYLNYYGSTSNTVQQAYLEIEIDYTEPPKPSFTNAPVLKVNNNTISSVDSTAVLTWTQASLDSNFSSLQSSVKYEIWVNDSKYSDAGTNLTFTYVEQPSSRKVIKVRAYIISSGVTYYSNYSNAVYYTYIPSGYVATKVKNDGQAYDPNWTGETDPGSQSIIYNFSSGETLWVNPKSDLEGGYSIYHLAYNIWGKVGYVSLAYLDWALNTLKYYDNGWKDCYIYYYNGSNWIPCMAYYYTGTEWKQCY